MWAIDQNGSLNCSRLVHYACTLHCVARFQPFSHANVMNKNAPRAPAAVVIYVQLFTIQKVIKSEG